MKKLIHIFILIFLVSFEAFAQTTFASVEHKDSLLTKARYLRSIYKTDEAMGLLLTLSTGGTDEVVMSELAECQILDGNLTAAIDTYGALIDLLPGNIPYRIRQMQVYSRLNNHIRAIECGRQILQLDSIPAVETMIGDSFLQAEILDSALVWYRHSYNRMPANPKVVSKYSKALLDKKQYEDVIEITEKYISQAPDETLIGPICGLAYYLKQDYKNCLRVMQHQKDIGNDSYGVHFYLGQASWQINDNLAALTELQRAWQIDSSDVNLAYSIGSVYAALALDPSKWLSTAEDMIRPDPKILSRIQQQYGSYWLKSSQYDKAIQSYSKAYDYYPDFISIISNIAYCYEKKKDWKNAKAWYEKYLTVGKPGTSGYDFVLESLEYVRQQLFMEDSDLL